MKKRRLMIFLFVLLVIILAFLLFILKVPKSSRDVVENVHDYNDIINQGNDILEYNHVSYILNNKNSIVKYDATKNSVTSITNSKYKNFYDKMYLVNNHLLFTADNVIYCYNILNSTINKVFDGCLEYADDNVLVYTVLENSKEYLYVSSYNKKNMQIDNEYIHCLAYGNDIFFLRKQEDLLLFGSQNSSGTCSVFCVDMKKQQSKVIVERCFYLNDESYGVLKDALILDSDTCFYIITNVASNTIGEYEINSDLYVYRSTYGLGEKAISDVGKNFCSSADGSKYLIEFYDDELMKNMWLCLNEDMDYVNLANDVHGDVTNHFSLKDPLLYLEEKEIGKIDNESWLSRVIHIGDTFYIFTMDSNYHYCYIYNGADLKKIY